jgi:hypothetical protein
MTRADSVRTAAEARAAPSQSQEARGGGRIKCDRRSSWRRTFSQTPAARQSSQAWARFEIAAHPAGQRRQKATGTNDQCSVPCEWQVQCAALNATTFGGPLARPSRLSLAAR